MYTAEVTAAGCGVFDYDNDGDLDLYLLQGNVLEPGKELSDAEYPFAGDGVPQDRLLRNDSDGSLRFTDVTEASGIEALGYGMGVATGDYDGDGWTDLYVANLGPNQLWRNQGDGTFEEVADAAGVQDPRWSVPASFFDYDRDGDLDLYVGAYVHAPLDSDKRCTRVTGALDFCGPMAYDALPDRLFRNDGGRFVDVTRESGIQRAFGSALGSTASDFNGDGWIDLYVANDGRPNQLWINQQNGRFVDDSMLSGTAVNAEGMAEASMGVEADDFDGDGDDDLFMTHLLGETNTVYRNDGSGMFQDVSVSTGLGVPSRWATAFGAASIDYDNDGWLDILTVNGEVRIIEEQARQDIPFPLRQPNQLFHNLGDGRFEERSAEAGEAFTRQEVSRGAAVGDFDNDGDHDVLILNNNGPAELLINAVGQDAHWLGLRLVGGSPARDMLGARIEVTLGGGGKRWRRVRTDGSYASARDPRVLVGLGSVTAVEAVTVHWPDGSAETWRDLEIDRYTTLTQGQGSPAGS
ncbi:hypothetical protein ABI59_21250 [Acidobacteria bacterium Mor1]|nr:hypothetical protein ABI59_21250 [Acidobacteria bacterium Mor1]